MSQFLVTKEIEFDAGHRVPDHASHCRNLHGHRYKVILKVRGYLQEEGSAKGMVLDFADIKQCLQSIHNIFDHGTMYYERDEVLRSFFEDAEFGARMKCTSLPYVPTAENLAKWCYDFAADYFAAKKLPGTVYKVIVYETPTSAATYPA